ncbi:MAG: metal ABC transporter permease [Syntrophomonadaceae bacterium]|nr:metal ABC transporter permease [Syntrophomonadaceae bacterium]
MEMLQYSFMQRALVAGMIIGIICPLIGIFLVLRRLSLIGEALAHVSLAGVATGLITGLNPTLIGLGFSLAGTLSIEYFRKTYERYAELAIAILMAAGMSLAIILISLGQGNTATIFSFLFGSIIAVSPTDLAIIAIIGAVVVLATGLLYQQLFYISFDEESAHLAGIPTATINLIFVVLVAMTVAVSMRIVGVLLVSSLMTIPVAASLQIARSFKSAVWVSLFMAQVSVIVGLVSAFYLDLAPGGTIILTSLALLGLTIGAKKCGIKTRQGTPA